MKAIVLGKFSWQKVLEILVEFTYLLVFFAVPLALAFFLKTDNVFELNKIVLFRSLVYVLFILTLIKAFFFSSRQKFSRRYLLPVLILIIFGAISLFFSIDPANSYYGLADRQQGYRSLLFYGWWFFLLLYNLVTSNDLDKKIHRIFWVIMGSSFFVSLYGLLQILGIDFISWTEPPFITHRTFSTLGQPNFLGSYLVLIMPLLLYGLIKYRKFWPRLILAVLLVFQLATLFATGSRSAWLGLLGALVLLAYWNLSRPWPSLQRPQRRGVILISFLLGLVAIISLFQNPYISQRLKTSLDFSHGSVSARFNFWSGAIQSISHRPLLGYGLENQGREFIKYYQVNWAQTGFVNAGTNRAHNLILDLLLTVGIIGLAVYTFVYFSFFKWANQNRSDHLYRFWSESLIAAVFAYLISLLFGFSIVVTEIYFFSYLAIVATQNARLSGGTEIDSKFNLGWPIKIIIIALALFFSGRQISFELKSLVADNYFLEMRQVLNQNDYPRALFYYQKIKAQNVNDFYYNYNFVDSLPYDLETTINPVIIKLFQKELIDLLPKLTKDNYDYYYLRAKIQTLLKDYPRALESYQKMIELSPDLPKNYFARAKFYVVSGRDDLALLDLKKVLELLPKPENNPESLSTSEKSVAYYQSLIFKELGDLYSRELKYDLAGANYRLSYLLNMSDLVTYKRIADSYFMGGDIETAIWYNLRASERYPTDYVWPFSLAVLYHQKGDDVNAIKYLDLALSLDSNKVISPTMIKSIRNNIK
ncbi:MAG: O-antigen ligase family protein [Patescibacteria group bacterium]